MSLLIDTSFKLKGYIESEIGGRQENQDSAGSADAPIGTIVVVCDGMGGMNGGKTASMLAVKSIIDFVVEAKATDSPSVVLCEAFKHAHKNILDASSKDPGLSGMGTTAVAIIFSERCATVAHLGDSRIYQLRGKKKVFRTTDHSMVFQLVQSGSLTEEQARLSSQSNIILKALGVDCDITPDVKILPYLKGDRFVLCTDGFWGAFPEDHFIRLISRRGDLKDVLWHATKEVNKKGIQNGGGHDNLTAALVDVLCESKIKPVMSKRQKIVLYSLVIFLFCSLITNAVLSNKLNNKTKQVKAACDYATAITDSTGQQLLEKAQQRFLDAMKYDSKKETVKKKDEIKMESLQKTGNKTKDGKKK